MTRAMIDTTFPRLRFAVSLRVFCAGSAGVYSDCPSSPDENLATLTAFAGFLLLSRRVLLELEEPGATSYSEPPGHHFEV